MLKLDTGMPRRLRWTPASLSFISVNERKNTIMDFCFSDGKNKTIGDISHQLIQTKSKRSNLFFSSGKYFLLCCKHK